MVMLRTTPAFGPVRRVARWLHHNLPPLNFITLHYAYFIGTCLISAVIFWGASTPARSVSFTDSLFLVVSAMTLAGLNTVNLSTLNTFQQFMLFFLIIIGSAIFVSAFVVHIRKRAFEKKFKSIIEERQNRGRHRSRSKSGRRSFSLSHYRASSRASRQNLNANETPSDDEIRPAVPDAPPIEKICQECQEAANAVVMANSSKPAQDQPRPSYAGSDTSKTVHSDAGKDHSLSEKGGHMMSLDGASTLHMPDDAEHISFHPSTVFRLQSPESHHHQHHHHHRFISMQGVGARPTSSIRRMSDAGAKGSSTAVADHPGLTPSESVVKRTQKYFPFSGLIGRNSQFYHLTDAEREQLGGVEYKAIRFLSVIVPLYFILFQLLGCLGLGAYVWNNRPAVARENGLNPFWVGAFNAVSAFNNSGMSLLDANMVAFQTSVYMLLTMAFLILAGNTGYPIFLRLIVWTMRKVAPDNERWQDYRNTLQFLLDHPRRCYTNLFPSEHTWWLFTAVVCLNGIDWIGFEILNIGNPEITKLPTGIEVLDGLFQAFAVRSGGFYVVPIPTVRISLQVLYVVMMYISVYPVVISIRNSNVYEERSLGIYADDPGNNSAEPIATKGLERFTGLFKVFRGTGTDPSNSTKSYFLRQQLRAQLSHDLWWLVLAVFLVMIIESSQFERDPANFSVFNVIFEMVSGYGCVGISLGVPNDAYSFCGSWHKLSKLVLCAVMLRGRHRGLPVAIDKAVLLPGEQLHQAEEEDAQIRLERSITRGSMA